MQQTAERLFSLIRTYLLKLPDDTANILMPDEAELEAMYALAERHDLAHLAGAALYDKGMLTKGQAISEKFQHAQVVALYRYTKLEYERKRIYEVFENAGIAYVPLKGIIIRNYYPQPQLRTSCDIDILVHREDLTRATEALTEKLGYKGDEGELHYHDISLFSPGGIHLELHFTIENDWEPIDRLLSKVWDHCTPVAEGKSEHRQNLEFFMFHQIAHMVSHFLNGGCGIRPLLDLQLLRQKMPFDDAVVKSMCDTCDIGVFYDHAKALSDVWFGDRAHNEVTRQMEAYILFGVVYGTLENTVAVKQRQKGGRFSFIMYRIFMPYRQLKVKYPVLVKHKWLYPVMTVRRWFALLSPAHRKRAQQELRYSSAHSDEKKQSVDQLLQELGLN